MTRAAGVPAGLPAPHPLAPCIAAILRAASAVGYFQPHHCCSPPRSFFPPDVRYVADHAKRAMSEFPECRGFYYGVDYRRWVGGVVEMVRGTAAAFVSPSCLLCQSRRTFVLTNHLLDPSASKASTATARPACRPGTRLDWYKNIPVPTSYMVCGTDKVSDWVVVLIAARWWDVGCQGSLGGCFAAGQAGAPATTPTVSPTSATFLPRRIFSAATTTVPGGAWCTWPATTSARARSSGRGATTSLGEGGR